MTAPSSDHSELNYLSSSEPPHPFSALAQQQALPQTVVGGQDAIKSQIGGEAARGELKEAPKGELPPLPQLPDLAVDSSFELQGAPVVKDHNGSEVGIAISAPHSPTPSFEPTHPFAQVQTTSRARVVSADSARSSTQHVFPLPPERVSPDLTSSPPRGVQLFDPPVRPRSGNVSVESFPVSETTFALSEPAARLPPSQLAQSSFPPETPLSSSSAPVITSAYKEEFNREWRYPSVASASAFPRLSEQLPISPLGGTSSEGGYTFTSTKEGAYEGSTKELNTWADINYQDLEEEEERQMWKKKVKKAGWAILILLIIIAIGVGAGVAAQKSADKHSTTDSIAASQNSSSTSSGGSRSTSQSTSFVNALSSSRSSSANDASTASSASSSGSTSTSTSKTAATASTASVSSTTTRTSTTASTVAKTTVATTSSSTTAAATISTSAKALAQTTSAAAGVVCTVGGITIGDLVIGGSKTTLAAGSSCATARSGGGIFHKRMATSVRHH